MTNRRCLYCYQNLTDEPHEYHAKCSKLFFGLETPPELSFDEKELEALATEIVKKSVTIPGVQPKLSLALTQNKDDPKRSRLTMVGLWGDYILKPQAAGFPNLPENEDLTMNLAEAVGLVTANHSLIRTKSGSLAYITKRFDRTKVGKVPMEDLCQLGEISSSGNNKYNSTMEKTGKIISKYSSVPGLDVLTFFELAIFSFITGNADMHLKNFSLIRQDNQYRLSPAYDMLCTVLAIPDDKEQMALHLNGKKNNIRAKDFFEFGTKLHIDRSVIEGLLLQYTSFQEDYKELINRSFLPNESKLMYKALIDERIGTLRKL